jgi:hypothetical protein
MHAGGQIMLMFHLRSFGCDDFPRFTPGDTNKRAMVNQNRELTFSTAEQNSIVSPSIVFQLAPID